MTLTLKVIELYRNNQNTHHSFFTDDLYILSFSILMLNTDAHNPNIKKKMTKAQFIQNNDPNNGIFVSFLAIHIEKLLQSFECDFQRSSHKIP